MRLNLYRGTLYGITSTDEDGKTVTEYTDKLGRKILIRANGNCDTYYVYDDLNNLRYVADFGDTRSLFCCMTIQTG